MLGLALASTAVARLSLAADRDPCIDARCVALADRVLLRGDRAPVVGVQVIAFAEPTQRKPGAVAPHEHADPPTDAWVRTTTTDEQGRFTLDRLPAMRVRVIVVGDGIERSEWTVDPTARARSLFVEPAIDESFRTVVAQRGEPPIAVGTATLSREELASLPGTQGDPLRALQSLPGVARTPAGLGLLVLRGAAPTQSKVFYGEHPLPRAFHTLGFTSVVQADAIESLEVQASNFSPRYGNASGGVVLLTPRSGRTDAVHGFGKIDLLSAGALVEGPLGKSVARGGKPARGSYLVAAQRGYVDGVLRLAERVDPTAAFSLPRYYDYQAELQTTHRATQYTVRALGSGDRIAIRYIEPDGSRTTGADLRDQFHRVEALTRTRVGPWQFLVTPAVRFDSSQSSSDYSSDRRRALVPSWRTEMTRRIGDRATFVVGTDGSTMPYATRSRLRGTEARPGELVQRRGVDTTIGVYGWVALRLGTLTFWPGVRVSGFSRITRVERTERVRQRFAVDPRLIARWELGRRWALRGGVGLYAQPDTPFSSGSDGIIGTEGSLGDSRVILPAPLRTVLDPGLGVGDADRTPDVLQAFQASGGGSFAARRGTSIDATAFVRMLQEPRTLSQNVVVPNPAPVTRVNLTRTIGAEVLLRQRIGTRAFAWLGYTVMRTDIGPRRRAWTATTWRPSAFDQRHSLVALASVELPKRFRLGARFRLVSGSPYTPVVGTIAAERGVRPLFGAPSSSRFPAFHQLDVRLDRRWLAKRVAFTAYIDIQNVYNRRNAEALVYSVDYREVTDSIGLPIFPSLGFRLDW